MIPVAELSDGVNVSLATVSLLVGAIAIFLAISHARQIGRVQEGLDDAQQHLREAEAQTRSNLEATKELGHETLAALNLHAVLLQDQDLSSAVREMASDFARVAKLGDPLMADRAREGVRLSSNYVNMAAEGQITIGPEALAADEEIPSALLSLAKQDDEFWASSVVSPEFWVRASAYLQQQRECIDAGVRIHRVFIFKDEASLEDDHAQHQLRQQHEAGIKVHYVVGPKHEPLDLVVLERPAEKRVLYAAEFSVSDGRVNRIELWSSMAGHERQVNRLWNALKRSYQDADEYCPREQLKGS